MGMKKKLIPLITSLGLILCNVNFIFADGARVVTLGANLNEQQRATILKYFGVNENEVVILEVNNQEERKYLEGVATEAQLGKKTYSCAYVEPTKAGSGINVKTANLTWLTSSMVASTLSTAGMTDADVVVASVFPVSGTGALTGIMKAFEDATGEALDEDKKELASEELIITGNLGENIGADKAAGIINDIKTEIIKNNTSDTIQIADTITNITNNYNVTLTEEQQKQIEGLMMKISEQDYDYENMKNALNSIKDTVYEKLDSIGEGPARGILEGIGEWFKGIGDKIKEIFESKEDNLSILNGTDDSLLGESALIDATDETTINLPSSEEVEGFFTKIWNWFKELFNKDNSNEDMNETNSQVDNDVIILEENSIIEEDIKTDFSNIEETDNSMENIDENVNNTIENTEETDNSVTDENINN